MTGRVVCLAATVLALLGVSFAEAQGPGPAYYGPGGYGGPPQGPSGWVPATRPYDAGPANRSWGNLSGDRGFEYEETPLDEFVRDVARDSYFRLEYLNWSFKEPGNTVLGAPVYLVKDPTRPFPVTVAAQIAGETVLPTTTGINLDRVNGIRGTVGIPLMRGAIEASIFSFQNAVEGKDYLFLGAPTFRDPTALPQFVATSTFTNGVTGLQPDGSIVSPNIFLYDEYYNEKLTSSLWGSEVNYLFDAALPEPYLQLRPMVGFRFVDFEEQFLQTGSYNDQGTYSGIDANGNPVIRLVSTIGSEAINRVYVPQIGFRAEINSRWVSLGFEPKFGLGVNTFADRVQVDRLRSPGDPTVITRKTGEALSVTGELNLYGRLHIRDNIQLTVGYTALFVDNVSRAHNSIFYDDPGVTATQTQDSLIRVRPSRELMYFQGLNVGAEVRF